MGSDPPGTIWTRPEPGVRGAAHSRQEIAAAAIALADAEGFGAVSMRRVAAELGAGTMTLYHYVRNKDELLELIADAIMGELLVPDGDLPADWREAMAEIARRTYGVFQRHPWTIEARPATEGGPNGLRHFEQSAQAASGTGLDRAGVFDVIFIVDDYVFGAVLRRNMVFTDGGVSDEWIENQFKRLPGIDAETHPWLSEFYDDPERTIQEVVDVINDETRFERGLQILLDGIERRIEAGW